MNDSDRKQKQGQSRKQALLRWVEALVSTRAEPTLNVRRIDVKETAVISVIDNGSGILHQAVLDKVFQPFFTSKPIGNGTELGLSLAYDIVKVYGSELKEVAKEEDRTTFAIPAATL